jgi:hypothetical protein
MNRNFLCILLLLSSYAGFSQNTFVSGHLSGIDDGQYIYLTAYQMGQKELYRDSAKMKKGMFALRISIPDGEGALYYISSVRMVFAPGEGPQDAIRYTHRWQVIYLQQGRAVINGDAAYLDSADYSGDAYMREENDYFVKQRANRGWENFKKRMAEAYARGENLNRMQVKDSAETREMFMAMYKRFQIAEAWVKEHPDSPYSAAVVYLDVSKFFDERQEEKASYFHLLSPAAKNNKIGKFLANWLH